MANLETLRTEARNYIGRTSASTAQDMFEIALKLKQSLDISLAAQLFRVVRTVSSDDETISRIDTQLMLVDGREHLSRLQKWFGYDFFISNAHSDSRPYAEALNDALRLTGFRCYLDKNDTPAGVELTTTLRVALHNSAALLFVGSPLSLSAPYVAKEIAAFTLLGRPVIPIDIGGTLSGSEWLLYRNEHGIADYVRVPESKEAFATARPSKQTIDGIQKLFKLRRRTTIRRSIVATAVALTLVAASIGAYQTTIAQRATLVDRANQIVFLGERIVDDEPATAIALALESTAFAEVPAAATLVRRAVHLLPERQRLAIRPGVIESGPKVLVDLKPLTALSLAVGGSVLLALDTDGQLSAWNVASGDVTTRIGDQKNKVSSFGVFGYTSNRVLIRFESGVIEERSIGIDSRLNLDKQWPDSYKGFAVLDGEDSAVAWQGGGSLVVNDSNGERVHSLPGEVRSVSIGEFASSAAVVLENGNVGKLSFDDGTWAMGPKLELGINRVEVTYIEPLDGAIIVERNDEQFQEDLHVTVLDLKKAAIIETRTDKYRKLAVDRAGGKLAWLSNSEVEQLELWRGSSDAKLVLRASTPSSRWAIEPMERDTGESQQILYGPFGEYLVTLNAPIMQLVGPFPGNAKLWYANAIGDERAGDPHRGLRLASRAQAVLNTAFDRTGSRLAVFFEDGRARVWDVLPERYINSHSKAADVFQRHYHIGLSTRALLEIPESETGRILQLTRDMYQVALPEEIRHKITTNLEKGASLAPLEQQLRRDAIATAALQSGGEERSEMKRWPREDGEKAAESIAKLADEIVHSIERGHAPDDEALRRAILQLVARHPIHLAAIESTKSLSEASNSDDHTRARGCILLALSGDTSFQVPLDQAVRSAGAANSAVSACNWASAFLRRTGRNLSIDGPLSNDPMAARGPLVSLPEPWLSSAWSNAQIPCQAAVDPTKESENLLVPPGLLVDQARSEWPSVACASLSDNDRKRVCDAAKAQGTPSFATLGLCAAVSKSDGYGGRLNLAILLRDKKRYTAALAWAYDLLNSKTDVKHAGSAENFYGYVLHLMGNNQEALSHFAHAIEQGRPDGWSERNMAAALSALGKNDEASRYYEKAIAKVEDLIATKAGTSRGQEILRQTGEEIGGFYNAYAWHLVTKPHASQSDGKKAIELALVASKYTDERNPDFLDTLAHAFALTGDVCKAAEVEERAVDVEISTSSNMATFLKSREEWLVACARL